MLASTVIDRVMKGFRDRANPDILAEALTATSTNVNLRYTGILSGWGPGTRVEIGSEIMLVVSVDTNNRLATVVRGWLETTIAAHPVDTPIYIQPRIYRSDVLELLNDCLEDLFGNDLYRVGVTELTSDGLAIGYAIPAEAMTVLRVDGLKDPGAGYWQAVYDWYTVDNTDLADFSTGKAIMIRAAFPPGAFRVVYTMPFQRLVEETDDLEAHSGLKSYMMDLPYYFAMNRLMVDLERHRSQMEAAQNHQRAQDASPFLALRTGEWYQARYKERIVTARAHQAKETRKAIGTGYGS